MERNRKFLRKMVRLVRRTMKIKTVSQLPSPREAEAQQEEEDMEIIRKTKTLVNRLLSPMPEASAGTEHVNITAELTDSIFDETKKDPLSPDQPMTPMSPGLDPQNHLSKNIHIDN